MVATTLRSVAAKVVPAKRNHFRLWQTRDRIDDPDSPLAEVIGTKPLDATGFSKLAQEIGSDGLMDVDHQPQRLPCVMDEIPNS